MILHRLVLATLFICTEWLAPC